MLVSFQRYAWLKKMFTNIKILLCLKFPVTHAHNCFWAPLDQLWQGTCIKVGWLSCRVWEDSRCGENFISNSQTNCHRFKTNFHNSLDLAKGAMDAEDIQISVLQSLVRWTLLNLQVSAQQML